MKFGQDLNLTADILSAFKDKEKLKELAIESLIFGATASRDYIIIDQINKALREMCEAKDIEISELYRMKILVHLNNVDRDKKVFSIPGGTDI